jgi:hypothetical protein
VATLACGCAGKAPLVSDGLLEPLALPSLQVPDRSDRAAARLAAAALVSSPGDTSDELAIAMRELREAESQRISMEARLAGEQRRPGPGPPGALPVGPRRKPARPRSKLVPLAQDLVNATLDDPIAYREASRELLRWGHPDPALEERLERAVNDDPLKLARKRIRDSRTRIFARTFNAVSVPLGQSLLTGLIIAPYQITMSAVHWVAGLFESDPLDLQERQALAHRKRFLAKYPDAPEAEKVRRLVEKAERELHRTHRDRDLRTAKQAMDSSQPRLALAMAERALERVPGDPGATRLVGRAREQLEEFESLRGRSLEAGGGTPRDLALAPDETLAALRALLLSGSDLAGGASALRAADPGTELSDEVEYLLALAQLEAGYQDASWERLEDLAARDPGGANMARHAVVLATSSWQNPYGSFVEARSQGRRRAVARELLGNWAQGPRYRKLPRALAYLIDAPAMIQTLALTPIRALFSIGQPRPDFQRPTSIAAYRYLERFPDGEHARELIEWLYQYQEGRENWAAALRLADFQPGFDATERTQLVEKVGGRQVELASRTPRRDVRASILREVVREYPDAVAGREAGYLARAEVEEASAQRIRMTRGFLVENPRIAGSSGLGIRDALLDGQLRNGELHPEGVTFLGGRRLEFALLDESGDEDLPPEKIQRVVSAERLARCVALLEESARRNSLVDPDDELESDAQRDYYFERARLGLVERPDSRPAAGSSYVFEGVREKYGMVRGRESILPFDLVLQGSFTDLSLGAYPRWREPKETPDAFLYR